MTIWRIRNYHKKNAVERQFWTKDGVTIVRDEGFRWGEWTCESDQRPDIDLDNADGYDVTGSDLDWDIDFMDDGCWDDWTWPDDMSNEERQRIQDLWNENWIDGLEDDGWENQDTEQWIYGPIELINEDTSESWHGASNE